MRFLEKMMDGQMPDLLVYLKLCDSLQKMDNMTFNVII